MRWRALAFRVPIILTESAEEELDAEGNRVGISIPEMEALVAAVAVTRALIPVQLSGAEVRFIRKAIGLSAKDFSGGLDIDPATYSRWENDKHQVGAWADKQVRMAVIIKLADRVPHLSVDRQSIVEMRITTRQGHEWPKIQMRRVPRFDAGAKSEEWDTLPLAA